MKEFSAATPNLATSTLNLATPNLATPQQSQSVHEFGKKLDDKIMDFHEKRGLNMFSKKK